MTSVATTDRQVVSLADALSRLSVAVAVVMVAVAVNKRTVAGTTESKQASEARSWPIESATSTISCSDAGHLVAIDGK